MSRVTIADVASAAGVSKTAVSFAFNNPKRLGHATLERVLGVAEDLGYMPHPAARALSAPVLHRRARLEPMDPRQRREAPTLAQDGERVIRCRAAGRGRDGSSGP